MADLLEKGKTPKARKELAEAAGIDVTLILKRVNMADLFRIKGMGPNIPNFWKWPASILLRSCGTGFLNICMPSWQKLMKQADAYWFGPARPESGADLDRGGRSIWNQCLLINLCKFKIIKEKRLWRIQVSQTC